MKKCLVVVALLVCVQVVNAVPLYQVTDLGTFGGSSSSAIGINNSGQVVGWSDISGVISHAFLYSNNSMQDLGTFGGLTSYAHGINNNGQVVGGSDISGTTHAFLYTEGSMVDLNSLIDPVSGWTLRDAGAVNDLGQIVGWGINADGQEHAFLLNPTPEPATFVLLSFGSLMLRRRR